MSLLFYSIRNKKERFLNSVGSKRFFYFNNHLPNKETNEKCLEKQRNQTKNRKTSLHQGNQRKLLRKTSPQQGNQRKASLDLAATRLVKNSNSTLITICKVLTISSSDFQVKSICKKIKLCVAAL